LRPKSNFNQSVRIHPNPYTIEFINDQIQRMLKSKVQIYN